MLGDEGAQVLGHKVQTSAIEQPRLALKSFPACPFGLKRFWLWQEICLVSLHMGIDMILVNSFRNSATCELVQQPSIGKKPIMELGLPSSILMCERESPPALAGATLLVTSPISSPTTGCFMPCNKRITEDWNG